MTKLQILANHGTAQVEITIFHADVVAAICIVFYGERRSETGAEHHQFLGYYLYFSCGEIGVLAFAFVHDALHLYAVFTAEVVGLVAQVFVVCLIKHELRDAIAVTKVGKCHATHLACALHPSGKGHFLALIGESKLSTCLCPVHIYCMVIFYLRAKVYLLS